MTTITAAEAYLIDIDVETVRTDAMQSFIKQATLFVQLRRADGLLGRGYGYTVGTGGRAGLSRLLDMSGWPEGTRVIVRKERSHPGAQLRITDVDGHRVTVFATNTKIGGLATQLPDLELRHRRRARCEDRIRVSKDTGLMNLPSRV